jgi:ubiquinone/menaquinone biosynthesis C-methylase UbiE
MVRSVGGARRHWEHFLLPRIRRFLPAGTILEIAPGHGRWTQFLAPYCQQLIVVDLSPSCIDFCKQRFATLQNISYFTNDGSSLEMVADGSLDFAFSFDSLVHADAATVEQYVRQLQKKLRPGAAVLFITRMQPRTGLCFRFPHGCPTAKSRLSRHSSESAQTAAGAPLICLHGRWLISRGPLE